MVGFAHYPNILRALHQNIDIFGHELLVAIPSDIDMCWFSQNMGTLTFYLSSLHRSCWTDLLLIQEPCWCILLCIVFRCCYIWTLNHTIQWHCWRDYALGLHTWGGGLICWSCMFQYVWVCQCPISIHPPSFTFGTRDSFNFWLSIKDECMTHI